MWTELRNQREGGHKDDDHAGDECRLGGSRKCEAEGLELVTGAEEESGERPGGYLLPRDLTELLAIGGRENKRGQSHSHEVKEERGWLSQEQL